VSANPFCVSSDGLLTVFDFHGDDVVALGVSDLLQEASLEVCQEVFWVLFPVRMQQVSEERVIRACCSVGRRLVYSLGMLMLCAALLAHLLRTLSRLRRRQLPCTFGQPFCLLVDGK